MKPIRRAELKAAIVKVLTLRPGWSTGNSTRDGGAEPPIQGRETGGTAKLRILLAEDNQVNQRVAARILQKAGHFVVVVDNGKKALETLRTQGFDLVLMDVQMPEMDGLEATRAIRLREQRTSSHLPVIALTAHAMGGDRERFLEAGMDDYISKPINARALVDLVEKYCPEIVHAA